MHAAKPTEDASSANLQDSPDQPHRKPGRWRRAFVVSTVVAGLALVTVLSGPLIVLKTPLRSMVLDQAFSHYGLSTACKSADGGWRSPLIFHDVEILDPENRFQCRIQEVSLARGVWGILFHNGSLGTVTLTEPRIELHADDEGRLPVLQSETPSHLQYSFDIEQGALKVIVPWRELPIVDVEHLAIHGRMDADDQGGRILTVEQFQVFDHEPLSDAHSSQNLALIAPVLSQSTQISGSASAWVDELKIRISPDGQNVSPFPIRGRAEFHSLSAALRQDWTRQIASLAGMALKQDLPDQIEVVRNSNVRFELTETGISHEGMVFVLPQISSGFRAESSGLIALDESLDLQLVVQAPDLPLPDDPTAALMVQMLRSPITVRVGGTVSDPDLKLPSGSQILEMFARHAAPDQTQPASVTGAVFDLIQSATEKDKDRQKRSLPGSIFGLIRAIGDQKSTKAPEGNDEAPDDSVTSPNRE